MTFRIITAVGATTDLTSRGVNHHDADAKRPRETSEMEHWKCFTRGLLLRGWPFPESGLH